ncbi:MAG: DUF1987 domain-containing protein [Bacteroidales bacterium]
MKVDIEKIKPLKIEAAIDSPDVLFDPETKIFSISGISHPENAKEFYQEILVWLDEYYEYMKSKEPSKIIVDLNFKYINSSSYKYLREVLRKISNFKNNRFTIEVIWNYHEEDEDILNEGVVLFELPEINLPYRCIPYC